MDGERFDRTLGGGATRRRLLTAIAALVGLHWSEAIAKRRGRRKKQARVQTQAAQPTLLVIDTEKPGGPFIGTFAASGAFVDEGEFEVIATRITGLESDLLLINHLTYEFRGEGGTGTFQITSQSRIMFGATSSTVDGHWRVTGGTGDYAGLRGAGSLEGTLDSAGIFHLTLTGLVQLA